MSKIFYTITKRSTMVLCIAVCYFIVMGFEILHYDGIVGMTKKNSGVGCLCHGSMMPTDSVIVWIDGPESVRVGSTNAYHILIKGGPAVAGGFNVAAGKGILSRGDESDSLWGDELTHVSPKLFQHDTVSWPFSYQAPASIGLDTIFSVGNSVDLNMDPTGDEWNYGANFTVKIVLPSDVTENQSPRDFHLFQNYPNPFNPGTTISYRLEHEAFVDISVYDLEGRLVAVPVKGREGAGMHSVRFDATGLASGIYIYRLEVFSKNDRYSANGGDVIAFKKMVLMK